MKPLVLDLPADASVEDSIARLKELHEQYRADYTAYYERYATEDSPAIRGADPAIVLIPGVGMFSYGRDKQTARVAGEFYINAINVMRGAEALSTYAPIGDEEKFRIEYWALEEAKLQRMPKPKSHATRIALVTGAASGIGKAIATRLAAEGACVVIADLDLEKAQAAAAELGSTDVAIGVAANVTSETDIAAGIQAALLQFGGLDLVVNNAGLSISKPLLETTVADWDLQHDVMAKGSFLVSKAAAKVLIEQGLGGDIVYISSKNSVFAGPNNIAYSATKADQAHQVRLLAAELGEYGVKVNGINPDGVVRGSGIFAGGWGAKRAAVYGVPGRRTRPVLRPAHPAQARSAPRERRQRRRSAHLQRPRPHHRPPHPRRRRRRRRLPAMSPASGTVAAVDLGATSGRVMHARVGASTLELTEAARFPNTPVRIWETDRAALHWNLTGLFTNILEGLGSVARSDPGLASIGVDSWAVDYGLLRRGRLLGEPYHYRDERTARGVESVGATIDAAELYRQGGLQFLPFNSLYQLAVDAADGELGTADHFLLIPDLITYWLTGVTQAERTNASTTGLLTADGGWNDGLIARLGLPRETFAPLVDAGTAVGSLLPSLAADLPFEGVGPTVTAIGSHDTASAVVAVPMDATRAAYISCGTWGLVGVELEHRVVSEEGRVANFTNEGGVDGRIRYLHNVMGLWLLTESLREWQRRGLNVSLERILAEAAELPRPAELFNADDPCFLAPGNMPARICRWFIDHGMRAPASPAGIVRVIIESLADAFASNVHGAAELSGVHVEAIHIVGGGARNPLLCQATADRSGLPVIAGPVEATALGNAVVQARAVGFISGDLETLRGLVARHHPPKRYEPATITATAARK